jgi:hypothetical protein
MLIASNVAFCYALVMKDSDKIIASALARTSWSGHQTLPLAFAVGGMMKFSSSN